MTDAPMWWTYILQCCDGSYYVDSTGEQEARFQFHLSGKGPTYTATRLPVQLVYSEEHLSLEAAVMRERQLKGWSRAKKAALISGDVGQLHMLSRCHQVITDDTNPPPGVA